jgi:hypothetical protein
MAGKVKALNDIRMSKNEASGRGDKGEKQQKRKTGSKIIP